MRDATYLDFPLAEYEGRFSSLQGEMLKAGLAARAVRRPGTRRKRTPDIAPLRCAHMGHARDGKHRSSRKYGQGVRTWGCEHRPRVRGGIVHSNDAGRTGRSEIVGRSRMLKSAMEIARIRKTVEITESGYLAAFRAAAPGMTERDLIAIIAEEWLMQGGETPYNRNNYEYLALQAGRILQMTPSPVDRKIERGDLIQIDGGRASAGTRRTFTATPISGRICLRRYTSMRRERAS